MFSLAEEGGGRTQGYEDCLTAFAKNNDDHKAPCF